MAQAKSTAEYISSIVGQHVLNGRPVDCPFITWLKGQEHMSIDELRPLLITHPDWTVRNSLEGIWVAGDYEDNDERRRAQAVFAEHVLKSDPVASRSLIERFLLRHSERLHPETVARFQTWILEHHPHPLEFVMQSL